MRPAPAANVPHRGWPGPLLADQVSERHIDGVGDEDEPVHPRGAFAEFGAVDGLSAQPGRLGESLLGEVGAEPGVADGVADFTAALEDAGGWRGRGWHPGYVTRP